MQRHDVDAVNAISRLLEAAKDTTAESAVGRYVETLVSPRRAADPPDSVLRKLMGDQQVGER